MSGFLADIYLWMKSLHMIAVITWMAGLFYLPRLYVYHVEQVVDGSETDEMFQTMERRLLHGIMHPSLIAVWLFGLILVFTPGAVDWTMLWSWAKTIAVIAMTWFHYWLTMRRLDFLRGENTRSGRHYRMMNELPTVLMLVIVFAVIIRF